MKNYILILFCSLLFCSFQYNGEVDYWKALKGVKQVKYDDGVLCGMTPSGKLICEKKRRKSCQFPKSAKRLDLKKIQIIGWIHQVLGGRKSMLVKIPFDLENRNEIPAFDEKIELENSFSKWQGKKVSVTGILRLNQEDGYRHIYILGDIEEIKLAE